MPPTSASPLFLGYPNLVCGYETGSFSAAECGLVETGTCPVFDRLVGTRLVVANAELRFPLVGIFTGEFDYGPVPAEGFVFADSGVAWTADDQFSFAEVDRRLVSSAGAGIRLNAFGYVILEFAAAKPFNRPDGNSQFVFNIAPGF